MTQGESVEKRFNAAKPMQVGGQAVLEGVMMRAPGMVATAVRRSNGEIVLKKEPHTSLGEKYLVFKLPVMRGAVGLIEMMVIGMRTLNFSAAIAVQDVENSEKRNGNGQASNNTARKNGFVATRESLKLGLTVAGSLVAGIALFFITPLLVATFFFNVGQEPFLFNAIAGGIRVGLLLVYLLAISMLRDIKRLFQYHGAEHKAVFAFERGEGLSVAAAARQSRFHPRCGTSFLLVVMIAAIVLFSILDALLIGWLGQLTLITRFLTHLPLIPLVGGVSYEFIKASAKRSETLIGRVVVTPGLWLQKITTKEPDDSQLEVALVALRCALSEDYAIQSPVNLLLEESSGELTHA
jgi:uncharacterized protein YqhQ